MKSKNKGNSPWVLLLCRLVLGFTFVVAAWPKIGDPASFAKIIFGYDIFPAQTINLLAIWVPWIEMITGICLILGIWALPSLTILNGMLTAFIVIISYNLLRGHSFDCGCFSVGASSQASDAVWLLVRDIGLLGLGLFLFRFYFPRATSS